MPPVCRVAPLTDGPAATVGCLARTGHRARVIHTTEHTDHKRLCGRPEVPRRPAWRCLLSERRPFDGRAVRAAVPFLLLAGALMLTACGRDQAGGAPGGPPAGGRGGEARAFPVRTMTVDTRTVTYRIGTVGDVVEENEFRIAAQVAGTARQVAFSEGDAVTTGQVLARIDHERYELMARRAQSAVEEQEAAVSRTEADLADITRQTSATIDTARVDLELAESEFRRRQGLAGGQVISVEDRLNAELRYRRARAVAEDAVNAASTKVALAQSRVNEERSKLEAARLALKLAQDDLERAIVRAPIAGTIQQRMISEERYLRVGDEVAVMVQTDPLRLRFTVPESKSAVLGDQITVRFTVTAHPDRAFTARVYDVGSVADPVSREVTCWARIDNPDGVLRPGNFAKVDLKVDSNKSAVVVPLAAVLPTEIGTVSYLVRDGRAVRQRVSAGVQVTGDSIEVLEGLQPGDAVVVEGGDSLSDNVPVRVVDSVRPAAPAGMPVAMAGEDAATTAPGGAGR